MLVGIALGLWVPACGGGAGLGQPCNTVSECDDGLQCLGHTCVPRCTRSSDCGDGYTCEADGVCQVVNAQVGNVCASEYECSPGQACMLSQQVENGFLYSSCQPEQPGGVLDDACTADVDCRNGTCDLGRCIDVCATDADCPETHVCTTIPRELADATVASFYGCLPARGDIEYHIPMTTVYERFVLPVPGNARSVALVSSIPDVTQLVGPARIEAPSGELLYQLPFTREDYFTNRLRTAPTPAISTVIIPETPDDPIQPGPYVVELGSYKDVTTQGTEVPTVDAIYKLDDSLHLPVHFYFLDLADHPCQGASLDAASAQTSPEFQDTFLRQLNLVFSRAGIVLGTDAATYEDIKNRPDLDGLDSAKLGDLLALSHVDGGVNVFFVRTIAPSGIQALVGGPPGPPTTAGTRSSGVAIALDTLCYRSWNTLARDTAHEIARWMGLSRSVEPDGHIDPIEDSDSSTANLMYFSDQGGTDLSSGQREILRLHPGLQ